MKKLVLLLVTALTFGFTHSIQAQKFSGLDASPADIAAYPSSYRIAKKAIKIVYSRPQLKGRSLAQLAPSGKVWRTGANESAEITFYKDVTFGGTSISAGTYSLFTIPGDSEWTVIISGSLNQWGAYSYDKAGDVARVSAAVSSGDENLEAFSIAFNETGIDTSGQRVDLVMGWGTTRVTVPISM
ncbi:MAG: DUF2911 domain-containing protein [Flavobacteriaceae bacterium]|nr:DUF2911 domain-containing protein [Flavobacteriaceae bacterium]MDH3796584.1 DUF2911 domain-containing protein [Flavobacteriaceae bacterium]